MHGSFADQTGADRAADAILDGTSGTISIPEPQILINAQFARSGDSLKIVAESGKVFLIQDYFKSDRPAPLVTSDGTTMLGESVLAIAGPRTPYQYAQAGAPAGGGQPQIGAVDKVSGSVVVIRNGASVTLNAGDAILKSDVIQTGAGGSVVIMMIDGTALTLGANTRMAMNEFSFEPNSANNSSLLNLLQGSFVFVAGQIAPNGGLNIETPVATMGIRGTQGGMECPSASCIAVATEGTYQLLVNGQVIGTVTVGSPAQVTPTAVGQLPTINIVDASLVNPTLFQMAAQLSQAYSQMSVPTVTPATPAAPTDSPPATPQGNPSGGSSTDPRFLNNDATPPGQQPAEAPRTITVAVSVPDSPPNSPPVFVTFAPPTQTQPANEPPRVVNGIANLEIREDTEWQFQVLTGPDGVFDDPEGANLTLTATFPDGSPLPNWLTFTNGEFRGSPPQDATGFLNIMVTASDGVSRVAVLFTLAVVNVPDAPILTLPEGGRVVAEDSSIVLSGASVTDVDDNDVITLTLSVEHGMLEPVVALPSGVSLIAGAPGESSITLQGSTALISALLTSGVSYEPDANYSGDDTLTVTVADSFNLSATKTTPIVVTPVNDGPTTGGNASPIVVENITTVTTLTVSDPDAGDSHSWTLSGADSALFQMNGDKLEFKAAPNFEAPGDAGKDNVYNVTATAKDSGGLTSSFDLEVTVTNANEEPTVTGNAAPTVVENTTSVTTLTVTDPDFGDGHTWILSGADAALFQMNGDKLEFKAPPDFEDPADTGKDNIYNVTATATDSGGRSSSIVLAVKVTDANDSSPTISGDATPNVVENTMTVTSLTVTDQDTGDSHTWTLSGADAALFQMNGDKLEFKAPPDFENPTDTGKDNIYEVTATATDNGGRSSSIDLAVKVTDANDSSPTISGDATPNVAENTTIVTTLTVTDPDAGDSHTWMLSGADAALFQMNGDKLEFKTAPDFEGPGDAGKDNVYNVTATATDSGGLGSSINLAVKVFNASEAPTILGNTSPGVAENTKAVTTFTVADPDVGDSHSWTLSGADASLFQMNGDKLEFKVAPNFEAPGDAGADNVYNVTATATDNDGLSSSINLMVKVANANEPPVLTLDGNTETTQENIPVELAGGSVSDPDAGALIKLTLHVTNGTFDTDGVPFADVKVIDGDGSDGEVSAIGSVLAINALLDAGITFVPSAGFTGLAVMTVKVEDQAGASDSETVQITVGPGQEAPELFLNGGSFIFDPFATLTYDGWTESNDNFELPANSPTTGDIKVAADRENLRLRLADNDDEAGLADEIERSFDLSGATKATLTFDYRRDIPIGDVGDQFLLSVSDDGKNFDVVKNLGALGSGAFVDSEYQSFSFDLTEFISNKTTIRFSVGDAVEGNNLENDVVFVDNIKISYDSEDVQRDLVVTYVGGSVPISVFSQIDDVDDLNLASALIVLTNRQAGDFFSIGGTRVFNASNDSIGNIDYTVIDTGASIRIELSGSAPRVEYQAVIDSISFGNDAANPSTVTRTVEVTVNDGTAVSEIATTTINFEQSQIQWIGTGEGNWNDAGSWNQNRVPNANDNVLVGIGGDEWPVDVTVFGSTPVTIRSLKLVDSAHVHSAPSFLVKGDIELGEGTMLQSDSWIEVQANESRFHVNGGTLETSQSDDDLIVSGDFLGDFEIDNGQLNSARGLEVSGSVENDFVNDDGRIHVIGSSPGAFLTIDLSVGQNFINNNGALIRAANANLSVTGNVAGDFLNHDGTIETDIGDILIDLGINGNFESISFDGDLNTRIRSSSGDVILDGFVVGDVLFGAGSELIASAGEGPGGSLSIWTEIDGMFRNEGVIIADRLLSISGAIGGAFVNAGTISANRILIEPEVERTFENIDGGFVGAFGVLASSFGVAVINAGEILAEGLVEGGSGTPMFFNGEVINDGDITANAFSYIYFDASVVGNGAIISNGSTLEFKSDVGPNLQIELNNSGFDRLIMHEAGEFDAIIEAFGIGDVIDLFGEQSGPPVLDYDDNGNGTGVLHFSYDSYYVSLDMKGDYTLDNFALQQLDFGWRIAYAATMDFDAFSPAQVPDGYGATGPFSGFYFNGAETVAHADDPVPPSSGLLIEDHSSIDINSIDAVEFIVNSFKVGDLVEALGGLSEITITGYSNGEYVWSVTVDDLNTELGEVDLIKDLPQLPVTGIAFSNASSSMGVIDDLSFTAVSSIRGSSAEDCIVAAPGGSRIFGYGGDDELTGNIGRDTFLFHLDSGSDRINGFEIGKDVVELYNPSTSLEDLLGISQDGGDALVTLGEGSDTIRFVDIDAATVQNNIHAIFTLHSSGTLV